MHTVLIIDDDDAIRRTLELHFAGQNFQVRSADTLERGREVWDKFDPEIVVLDLKLPDGLGTSLIESQMSAGSDAMIVMITGHHDLAYAIQAIKNGAFNYIHKPLDLDELDTVVARAVEQLKSRRRAQALELESEWRPNQMVGSSRGILEVHKQIGLAAKSRVNVLITGETGTGKELVARAIHEHSTPQEPFVAVNCSAIVPTLMESEFFGHERGAFTGAIQRKLGKFELAGNGTVFLDEIADLSVELQAKLLRVLQERQFERVGGATAIGLEARVIAATNRTLGELIQTGRFREDLLFRLNVIHIHVPPLRERKEDLPALVGYLLKKINRELHRQITHIPERVMQRIEAENWPGNVRELENVLTQAVLRSTGTTLAFDTASSAGEPISGKRELKSLEDVEREHIQWVLNEVGGNLGKACEVLGITRPTLRKKMEDYGISSQH